VDHPDMSERKWQEYVISVLHLERKYRKVTVGRELLSLENIAGLSSGLDCPLFHPNFIGSLLLTRMASEDGLKVLISGEGADELFLGYRWFFSKVSPSEFLEYVPFGDIQSVLQVAAANPMQTSSMTQLEMFQRIYLQRWLQRQDLTGMTNSVEIRVPFLGLEFAKLINQLSMEFKRGNGEAKWLIKRMLSNKFSKEFRDRKKIGFDFPLNDWIGEEHVDFLRRDNELIERATLNAILQKYEGSYMKNRIVFSLVSLSLWQRSLD
jgi:asparagine synthase (glutamine-hydrolysing)